MHLRTHAATDPRAGDVRSRPRAGPGHALVSADFTQIEFRVAAAFA